MKDSMILIFERTINNCFYYLHEHDIIRVFGEIECARGIYYCLEDYSLEEDLEDYYRESFDVLISLKKALLDRFDDNKSFVELFNTWDKYCKIKQ